MDSFFIYREPFEEVCHCYTQPEQPSAFSSLTALNGREGFVIAPFSCHTNDKVYLLDGPKGTSVVLPLDGSEGFKAIPDWQDDAVLTASSIAYREDYHNDFCRFHSELERNTFRKLVLARSVIEQKDEHMSPRDIFLNACSMYPRSYIALFYTPATGMWLIASPEILLRGDANGYQTMALAGTMRYAGEDMRWSDKNREEQQLVTDYIRTCLQPFAMEVTESEPYTTRAAHLAHLRTDFRFLLKDRQPSLQPSTLPLRYVVYQRIRHSNSSYLTNNSIEVITVGLVDCSVKTVRQSSMSRCVVCNSLALLAASMLVVVS